MIRTCLAALTGLALLTATRAAEEPTRSPKGEPPALFLVTEVTEDAIVLKGPGSVTYRSALKDLDISNAAGKKLTAEDLLKRVKAGSVVVVASDENAIDPGYLKTLKDDTLVFVGVTVLAANPDRPGHGWTLDLKNMKASDDAVEGRVFGAEFKPKVQLVNTGLSLQSGNDMIHIFLNLKPGEGIAGKSYQVGPDDSDGPAVHVHVLSTKPGGVQAYGKGYAMRLEFGPEKDGSVPAKLYLCLPDERKSWLAGSFTLNIR
jgi:hypothetical protein